MVNMMEYFSDAANARFKTSDWYFEVPMEHWESDPNFQFAKWLFLGFSYHLLEVYFPSLPKKQSR